MKGLLADGGGLDSRMMEHRRTAVGHTDCNIHNSVMRATTLALEMTLSVTLRMGRRLEVSGYRNAVDGSDGGLRRGRIVMHTSGVGWGVALTAVTGWTSGVADVVVLSL